MQQLTDVVNSIINSDFNVIITVNKLNKIRCYTEMGTVTPAPACHQPSNITSRSLHLNTRPSKRKTTQAVRHLQRWLCEFLLSILWVTSESTNNKLTSYQWLRANQDTLHFVAFLKCIYCRTIIVQALVKGNSFEYGNSLLAQVQQIFKYDKDNNQQKDDRHLFK